MIDNLEQTFFPTEEVKLPDAPAAVPEAVSAPSKADEAPPAPEQAEERNGSAPDGQHWHAEAGRKGARRVHQLIKEGKLYEQEHGLKSGRQRLRQLLELGKLYEQEHGMRPAPRKQRGERLSRGEREELLATLLGCLLRLAKPSFRAELVRLVEALSKESEPEA